MLLFFTPDIQGEVYQLPKEESRHVIRVLRMKMGDILFLTDGAGNLYRCSLASEDPNRCLVTVMETLPGPGKRNFHLHLAVAPTKNIARFEWLLEKATEIGIEEITPMLCDHSERKQIRNDRLERVMIAAMKQSLKAYLPRLNEMKTFHDVIHGNDKGLKFIAHLDEQQPAHLKEKYYKGEDVIILIGPEGDFSPTELESASKAGFEKVSLGSSRLRTETAGLAACNIIAVLNE